MKYPHRVKPGSSIDLSKLDTAHKGDFKHADEAREQTEHYTARLRELQYLLYAEGHHSLLICLQGLDTSGKDGTIRHVFGYMNPQGCRVQAFKVPTDEEARHDFLWRAHRAAPGRGEVVIFNRSHYEDVLITRVHNLVSKDVCSNRYRAINEFEQQLVTNSTCIIKFFLHISAEEQLDRFKHRLHGMPFPPTTSGIETWLYPGLSLSIWRRWFCPPQRRRWILNRYVSAITRRNNWKIKCHDCINETWCRFDIYIKCRDLKQTHRVKSCCASVIYV